MIFPTHVLAFNLFSGLSKLGLKLPQATMDGPLWWAAACVFALACAVPANRLLQRLAPSVFGKRRAAHPPPVPAR